MEGKIGMGRRQRRVVIAAPGIDMIAPRRLDGERDMAEAMHRQAECPVAEEGIGLGRAPAGPDGLADPFGQGGEGRVIGLEREGDRSAERRVGTECGSTGISRWSTCHYKKNTQIRLSINYD